MIRNANCPERPVLVEFAKGTLADVEIGRLESHLAECPGCGDALRSLQIDDTFVRCVEQSGSMDELREYGTPCDGQLAAVIQRLEKISLDTPSSTCQPNLDARRQEVESLLGPATDQALGQLARYRLLRPLGAGGMGVVYQAEDTKLGRLVALKILRPSLGNVARQRFLQEARAAATIEDGNVVQIYDVGMHGRLAYLAMQWLDGETLAERLEREQIVAPGDVTEIGGRIAMGLAAAHREKLIHRDVKPANIWLAADHPQVRILDFGLARCVDDDVLLTETGMIAGTPAYMSPEQAQGRSIDERSDLFSLGAVMYHMLTGRLPFQADNALATLRAIQDDTPPSPRQLDLNVPAWLSDLVMDLLEKDPRQRPVSAMSVVASLNANHHKSARTAAGGRRGHPPAKHWIMAFGGPLLVALGVFLYRIATDHGDIVIESHSSDVQVEVVQEGKLVRVVDTGSNDQVTLRSGTYELRLADPESGFTMDRNSLTLQRNGKEIVTVRAKQAAAEQASSAPIGRDFGRLHEQLTSRLSQLRGQITQDLQKALKLYYSMRTQQQNETDEKAKSRYARDIEKRNFIIAGLAEKLEAMDASPGADVYRIATGQLVRVDVDRNVAGRPIRGEYLVEPSGHVALGAVYGRAFVAGMTTGQAEISIADHLSTLLKNPQVQVTQVLGAVVNSK